MRVVLCATCELGVGSLVLVWIQKRVGRTGGCAQTWWGTASTQGSVKLPVGVEIRRPGGPQRGLWCRSAVRWLPMAIAAHDLELIGINLLRQILASLRFRARRGQRRQSPVAENGHRYSHFLGYIVALGFHHVIHSRTDCQKMYRAVVRGLMTT